MPLPPLDESTPVGAVAAQLQCLSTSVLAAIAQPGVDLRRIVRSELASRGCNARGTFVGFDCAVRLFESEFPIVLPDHGDPAPVGVTVGGRVLP